MDLLRDIRFAGRLLVKNRWFTVMAIVVLALGIGANNAVFTIVNARAAPEPAGAQARGDHVPRHARHAGAKPGCVAARFRGLEGGDPNVRRDVVPLQRRVQRWERGADARQIPGAYVSPNLFKMLGVSPPSGGTSLRPKTRPARRLSS